MPSTCTTATHPHLADFEKIYTVSPGHKVFRHTQGVRAPARCNQAMHVYLRRPSTQMGTSVTGMRDTQSDLLFNLPCTISGGNGTVFIDGKSFNVNGGVVSTDALHPDGAVNVDACLALWRRYHHRTVSRTVWGNLAADPRTAPSKDVALVTYNAWFARSCCDAHGLYAVQVPWQVMGRTLGTATGGLPLASLLTTSHTATSSV